MKFKKLLSFVAAAAMTITSLTSAVTFTASAANVVQTYTGDGDVVCTLYDDGSFVVSGTGSTWPTTEWKTDGNLEKITSVEIQEGVTGFAAGAFQGCQTLTSVTIPESITRFSANLFNGCSNESLVIDVKGTITSGGMRSLYGTKATVKVYNLDTLSALTSASGTGPKATDCTFVYLGEMPPSSGAIGETATYNYDEATKTMTISGTGDLYSNTDAKFMPLFNGAEKIVIEEGITSIGSYLFNGYKNAVSINIPSTVTTIGSNAFAGCTSLVVDYKADVSLLKYSTFEKGVTVQVHSIEDLKTLTNMGGRYFSVEMADDVVLPTSGKIENIDADITWSYNTETQTLTLSGTGAIPDYDNSGNQLVIDAAIIYGSEIKNIVYQDGITSYGGGNYNNLWSNCSNVEYIEMADSILTIPGSTFLDMTSLKSVKLSNSLTSLPQQAFTHCESLTDIIIPDGVTSVGTQCFQGCTSLEQITLGKLVTEIPQSCFGFSEPNEKITIYIKGMITSVGAGAFNNVAGTIYVYDENTKTLVSENAESATVILVEDKFSSLKTALLAAGNYNEKTALYTEDSFKALTDAVAAGNVLLEDEDAQPVYIDEAAAEINNAIAGLTFAGYSSLETLIEQAEDIISNHSDEYVNVMNLNNRLSGAKTVLESAKSAESMTEDLQTQVNEQVGIIQTEIDKLEKVNIPAELEKLQEIIQSAEALDYADYTEESWAVVASAIETGKTMNDSSKYNEITKAQKDITDAVNNLVLAKLYPIVEVPKGGKEVTIAEITADEKIAGATQIRFTFDCAEDVTFSQYATIDFNATVAGVKNYKQFTGDSSVAGGVNQVVLPLASAVNEGESIVLSSSTWSWNNAKDYVYAVTKVEFLDENGKVMLKVKAKDIISEELAETIANAEALDTADYTDESVAELKAAIEAAKALTDEATEEDLKSAITAIENAADALAYKPADYTKVDEALAKVPTDLTKYTADSVKALNDVLNSVDRNKNITEQAVVDGYVTAIEDAIAGLVEKPTEPSSKSTTKTPAKTTAATKATRSSAVVAKEKKAAEKAMKQAKIKKLKVKSKAKKKITVTWKKVKKAVGYEVQISNKKNFKKVVLTKTTAKKKLVIKNKKLKSGKKYFVRVRAYATYKDKNNTPIKVYSNWNKKLRKVTVK